ncbi:MAG: hypothetical protein ABIO70_30965 [Pseudomonadota bacterium]
MLPTLALALLLVPPLLADPPAAPVEEAIPEPLVEKAFLLVAAAKDWDTARSTASQAAQALALELKVEVAPLPGGGLTFPAATCTASGFEHPCYVARGRYDDGAFVSVEWSSDYQGFTPGLYIVVAASGPEAEVKPHLAAARELYPDAYIKKAKVWMGCIH